MNINHSIIDIAIIGGGVSGAYSAYRLLKEEPQKCETLRRLLDSSKKKQLDIQLYESGNRIGGRLWSYEVGYLPNIKAELGGVNFHDNQKNVFGLCSKELNLTLVEPQGRPEIQYLRGKRFRFADYYDEDGNPNENIFNDFPFFLAECEKKPPGELFFETLDRCVPGFKNRRLQIEDLKTDKRLFSAQNNFINFLRGVKAGRSKKALQDQGFWNLLSSVLSHEGYDFLTRSFGTYALFQNWNAFDSLLGFVKDSISRSKVYTLEDGYQSLPIKLVESFINMGGKVSYSMKLIDLQRLVIDGQKVIKLKFDNISDEIFARNVILALPQSAIKNLNRNCILLKDESFSKKLDTITASPASKLYLTYNDKWWSKLGIDKGYSSTSLPLRLCSYIGTEKNNKSLLLASLNDSFFTQFWDSYQFSSRFGANNPTARNERQYIGSGSILPSLQASTEMVNEAQYQLSELHDIPIPTPIDAIYKDWTDFPFGGGWHNWNPHIDSFSMIPQIRKPIDEENIYICGEAYSSNQGWVEGAINSAEKILEEYFSLPRPDWVDDNYSFGP